MVKKVIFCLLLTIVSFTKYSSPLLAEEREPEKKRESEVKLETLTVGGGCFWCVEAVFQQFKGVEKVVSGYAGGTEENPTYESVSEGTTGHAEVIQISYDPGVISIEKLLTIFFHSHDPTTKNQQGADKGPQYRSIILYVGESQKTSAEKVMAEIKSQGVWGTAPLTTELVALTKFYAAEGYHQNYYNLNSSKPYCSFVIAPKIKKVRNEFKELLKSIS
jgi:peptide-methionine (S)-S-oxide reductase